MKKICPNKILENIIRERLNKWDENEYDTYEFILKEVNVRSSSIHYNKLDDKYTEEELIDKVIKEINSDFIMEFTTVAKMMERNETMDAENNKLISDLFGSTNQWKIVFKKYNSMNSIYKNEFIKYIEQNGFVRTPKYMASVIDNIIKEISEYEERMRRNDILIENDETYKAFVSSEMFHNAITKSECSLYAQADKKALDESSFKNGGEPEKFTEEDAQKLLYKPRYNKTLKEHYEESKFFSNDVINPNEKLVDDGVFKVVKAQPYDSDKDIDVIVCSPYSRKSEKVIVDTNETSLINTIVTDTKTESALYSDKDAHDRLIENFKKDLEEYYRKGEELLAIMREQYKGK